MSKIRCICSREKKKKNILEYSQTTHFPLLFWLWISTEDKFGERSRVSPCFGMPVPPAVSCFLSHPFHSLSTGPFNGIRGACRATRQRDAPPHAKCIRIEVCALEIVSASVRSRTKAENRASLGEQCAKAISDIERMKRRRRAQVWRRPGEIDTTAPCCAAN